MGDVRLNEKCGVELVEKDYLSILDVIFLLRDCQTRKDFQIWFEKNFLPLFHGENLLWHWMDPEFTSFRLYQPLGVSEADFNLLKDFFVSNPYQNYFSNQGADSVNTNQYCGEVTRSTDKSRKKSHNRTDLDLEPGNGDHPPFPWAEKDKKLFPLIKPHLLGAIESVTSFEEQKRYKRFAEALSDNTSALGMICPDMRVILSNQSFKNLLGKTKGEYLQKGIIERLQKESRRFSGKANKTPSRNNIPITIDKTREIFMLSYSQLKKQEQETKPCWLIRLKPAAKSFLKLNQLKANSSLTNRETEIVHLVREGMDDKEIAQQLFISLHTVKSHMKKIHKKLNVHSRAQLISFLTKTKKRRISKLKGKIPARNKTG